MPSQPVLDYRLLVSKLYTEVVLAMRKVSQFKAADLLTTKKNSIHLLVSTYPGSPPSRTCLDYFHGKGASWSDARTTSCKGAAAILCLRQRVRSSEPSPFEPSHLKPHSQALGHYPKVKLWAKETCTKQVNKMQKCIQTTKKSTCSSVI